MEYIGLVVHVDPDINQVTEEFSQTVQSYHEENKESKEMKFPM